MSRTLFVLGMVGVISGVMILFVIFVGREMFYDWKRGRRVRKIAGDADLADQAIEDFQLQTELDDALLERGLVGYKKIHPAEYQRAMGPILRVVR